MMMKMHGLQDGAYWLVQYSWFLLLYVVYAAALLIFGTITNLAVFTYNDYGKAPRLAVRRLLLVMFSCNAFA